MAREGRELFYFEKHLIEDAKLHDVIIADGDEEAARRVSDKVARRLGLSAKEIAALHRPPAEREQK
jgi:hypothetical protein